MTTILSLDSVPERKADVSFHTIQLMPKKTQRNKWDIVTDNPFDNCNRIHPLQQDRVAHIIDGLKGDKNIKKIMIFGSSVTDKCHVESDVDIYVELTEDKKIKMPLCRFPYDLWTNFSVGAGMYEEIKRKGVVVYGHE